MSFTSNRSAVINYIMGNLINSVDPNEMQHNAAFHKGLNCLLRIKPIFRARNTS